MPPKGIAAEQVDSIQKELLQICYYISPNYFPVVEPAVIDGKHLLTFDDITTYESAKTDPKQKAE